ncbi:MAG: hypothetical protein RL173_795 [Fibrobacterota bacterium]|jgi:hypothetical protein
MNPPEFVTPLPAPSRTRPTELASILALALTTILTGCGFDDQRVSGKGVITETTNAPAARGRLVSSDSIPIRSGQVRVVVDEDTPEAWNGTSRATSLVSTDGTYRLNGLNKPAFVLYAQCLDANGRTQSGTFSFAVSGVDEIALPDLVVSRPASIQGRYAAYDSVAATLTGDYRLRAKVRGLGKEKLLDSVGAWRFDSIPAGTYRVRVEMVDWIPGHETTLWDSTFVAQ